MSEQNGTTRTDSPGPSGSAATRSGLEEGVALCMSGGGYRAMLFHVGALWRLHETKILPELARISSVSGGSIVAGVLALRWSELVEKAGNLALFESAVVTPLRSLASWTIDVPSILGGLLLPGGAGGRLAACYDRQLFNGKTLQDLPDGTRFVINATNLQSGVLWRFSKPYMRDYKVGEVRRPTVPLSVAVAASSAFPPFLSPVVLHLRKSDFTPKSGRSLQRAPYTSRVVLGDGGIYDNLGLAPVLRRYSTVLVSDGGARLPAVPNPSRNWFGQVRRVLSVVDNQVRAQRKEHLIGLFQAQPECGRRQGAYWGILTDIADYGTYTPLLCPSARTKQLADLKTRLKALPPDTQERLINWGYAVCDVAIRTYFRPSLDAACQFPYPQTPV